ncbi:hypothetical protein ACN1NW_000471 [Acinetobacter baumannii]|nr:hypothetical protein [Acinetobacter baumannii]ELA7031053.1 hypothetical protein [Acinetobacter baumannii]ELA7118816.1 hypothetical protein [Acinetobacter baumannii]ELB0919766.1 hypothetical protein [Acinetobacter baumannii]ELB0965943.1 hypothetical protein [Acinetobacter baumannii]
MSISESIEEIVLAQLEQEDNLVKQHLEACKKEDLELVASVKEILNGVVDQMNAEFAMNEEDPESSVLSFANQFMLIQGGNIQVRKVYKSGTDSWSQREFLGGETFLLFKAGINETLIEQANFWTTQEGIFDLIHLRFKPTFAADFSEILVDIHRGQALFNGLKETLNEVFDSFSFRPAIKSINEAKAEILKLRNAREQKILSLRKNVTVW